MRARVLPNEVHEILKIARARCSNPGRFVCEAALFEILSLTKHSKKLRRFLYPSTSLCSIGELTVCGEVFELMMKKALYSLVFLLLTGTYVYGQAANNPDVIVFKDGEKLIGHLVSTKGGSVVFKSDAAGQVTVDWSKIQELRTSEKFAVIPTGVELKGKRDQNKVSQGTITATDQQVQVNTGAPAPQTVPTKNVAQMVEEANFERAFTERGFFGGWIGGASGGVAYTDSTQSSENFSGAVNLSRPVPGVDWLDPRSNTLLSFNGAYGKISEAGTPSVKTALYHAGIEQDFYANSRLFFFGQALFDHNYSQGLNLQQDYGGGLGFVVFKRANSEFDVKASVDYINQQFQVSSQNKSLIGSVFGENYTVKFFHGIVFSEKGGYTPAWNDTTAYSAFANAALTFPVYHRLGFTIGGLDTYLNDPPVGFKKNSFTLTLGATYSFQ